MIRRCDDREFDTIWTIINDGARAYKGVIPSDRWTEPYMSKEKLNHEIEDGVSSGVMKTPRHMLGSWAFRTSVKRRSSAMLMCAQATKTAKLEDGCSRTYASWRKLPCSLGHGQMPRGRSRFIRNMAFA